jgi:hypothetical protein
MLSNPVKKRKTGLTGTKIILGMVSLAGTFGLWNIFAAKQAEVVQTPSAPDNGNSQDANANVLVFPPMPTLVPIYTDGTVQNQAQDTSGLRQVSQPTPVQAIKNKPVFQQFTINRPGASSSSSSSGSSR